DFGVPGRLAPPGAAARLERRIGVAEHGVPLAAVAERPFDGYAAALPGGLPGPGADPLRTARHPTGLSPHLPQRDPRTDNVRPAVGRGTGLARIRQCEPARRPGANPAPAPVARSPAGPTLPAGRGIGAGQWLAHAGVWRHALRLLAAGHPG